VVHSLVAAVHTQLGVHVSHVGRYRVHGQVELAGDLVRCEVGLQVAQDADLARRERLSRWQGEAQRLLPAGHNAAFGRGDPSQTPLRTAVIPGPRFPGGRARPPWVSGSVGAAWASRWRIWLTSIR